MKVTVIQCDGPSCKHTAELHADVREGWFRALMTNRLQHMYATDRPEEGDFCSPECFFEWADQFALASVGAK